MMWHDRQNAVLLDRCISLSIPAIRQKTGFWRARSGLGLSTAAIMLATLELSGEKNLKWECDGSTPLSELPITVHVSLKREQPGPGIVY
jgi:hypothetical protein